MSSVIVWTICVDSQSETWQKLVSMKICERLLTVDHLFSVFTVPRQQYAMLLSILWWWVVGGGCWVLGGVKPERTAEVYRQAEGHFVPQRQPLVFAGQDGAFMM